MFVHQNTQDRIGRRAFALRGLGGLSGPEPVTVYDVGGRIRTLNLGVICYPEGDKWGASSGQCFEDDPLDLILPPIDPSRIPATLMAPLQQVPVPASFSFQDWFRADSIVPKVPNWALAGLGGMLVLAVTLPGGGKRKRR